MKKVIMLVAVLVLCVGMNVAEAKRGHTIGLTVTVPLNFKDIGNRGTLSINFESYSMIDAAVETSIVNNNTANTVNNNTSNSTIDNSTHNHNKISVKNSNFVYIK